MTVPDRELVSFNESDRMMYITTVVRNMSGDQWEKEIVIGNRSNYTLAGKRYYNAPLNKDNTYYLFVRAYAYSHNDSVRCVYFMLYLFKADVVESKIRIKWLV